jgi:aspartyl/asparaginyl beta-hydroxylase (cupin superfamily)
LKQTTPLLNANNNTAQSETAETTVLPTPPVGGYAISILQTEFNVSDNRLCRTNGLFWRNVNHHEKQKKIDKDPLFSIRA